ncbi:MAG: 3-deoxy-7-phosphoheptulonate synthase class II [bacterium]|nr:3-deoxy-7-phosphoheptulonate synthase class II [bacterium]
MNKEQRWSKSSWQTLVAAQQPNWPDQASYASVLADLERLPPLVFAGEARKLKSDIARAQRGEAFLLQGGDCAEEFARCTAPAIRETLKVILQMSVILTYAGEKPVIKVGRIAGQYAKPRSSDTEVIDGLELPSYRGDIINSPEFTEAARLPDADRLRQGYFYSAATLNILRGFTKGGFASLERVHSWNNEFVSNSKEGKGYERLAGEIDKALKFIGTIGMDMGKERDLNQVDFYTSHEALLLAYEEAMTRCDSTTGEWYDCSAHMLWIGDRTRQLDGAHVEFLRGVRNPIGMKLGPNHDIDEIKRIIDRLNPDNEPGRMTMITRFGADLIDEHLPKVLRQLKGEGYNLLWSCDPMHGNTYKAGNYKTRSFEAILKEIGHFFHIHRAEGTIPGGIHFELTGEAVTECVGGGSDNLEAHQLEENYLTSCDPRLNGRQSLDIAFMIAHLLKHP